MRSGQPSTSLNLAQSHCPWLGQGSCQGRSVLNPDVACAGTRVAHIQRSCGYALRPTLDIGEIDAAVQAIKAQNPACIVTVDNCYGEFTAEREPCAVRLPA